MVKRANTTIERPRWATAKERQDAVALACASLMRELHGGDIRDVTFPDEYNRTSEDIDLAGTIGGRHFAFDHTCIEQFPDALRTRQFAQVDDRDRFNRLHDALEAGLPPGDYWILMEIPDGTRRELDRLFAEVERWILSEFPTPLDGLAYREHPRRDRAKQGSSLTVRATPHESTDRDIHLTLGGSDDEIDAREAVIERAFRTKVEKLAQYKAAGSTTVLVLDDAGFTAIPHVAIISASALLEQPKYSAALDYVIKVSAELNAWTLQYARAGQPLTKKTIYDHSWLYEPKLDFLTKYDPNGRGSVGQLWDAMEKAGLPRPPEVRHALPTTPA